jgi:hypothetical protein
MSNLFAAEGFRDIVFLKPYLKDGTPISGSHCCAANSRDVCPAPAEVCHWDSVPCLCWGQDLEVSLYYRLFFSCSLVSGSLVLWFSVSVLGCVNTFRGACGEICPHGFWPRLLRDLVGAQSFGKEGFFESVTQSLE